MSNCNRILMLLSPVAVSAAALVLSGRGTPANQRPQSPPPQAGTPSSNLPQVGAAPTAPVCGQNRKYKLLSEVPDSEPKHPGESNYDPVRLKDLGVRPPIFFAAEPRDLVWAPQMEDMIKKMLPADLAFGAPASEIIAIECRTATCRIEISAPRSTAVDAYRAVQFTQYADWCSPRPDVRPGSKDIFIDTHCYSPKRKREEYVSQATIDSIRLEKARRAGASQPAFAALQALEKAR